METSSRQPGTHKKTLGILILRDGVCLEVGGIFVQFRAFITVKHSFGMGLSPCTPTSNTPMSITTVFNCYCFAIAIADDIALLTWLLLPLF